MENGIKINSRCLRSVFRSHLFSTVLALSLDHAVKNNVNAVVSIDTNTIIIIGFNFAHALHVFVHFLTHGDHIINDFELNLNYGIVKQFNN